MGGNGYKLPDNYQTALLELRENSEQSWRAIGRIALEAVGEAKQKRISKTQVYQACAYVLCKGTNTVRQYAGYVERFDDLLDMYNQLTIEQLRLAIREARRDDCEVADVVVRRCEKSADGFSILPPDAWAAELRNGNVKKEPAIITLLATLKRLGTLDRQWLETWPGEARDKVQAALYALDDLADKVSNDQP